MIRKVCSWFALCWAAVCGWGGSVLAQAPNDGNLNITPTTVDLDSAKFIDFGGIVGSIASMAQPIIVGIVVFGIGLFVVRFFMRLMKGMGR